MVQSNVIALACDGDYANTQEGKTIRESLTLEDAQLLYAEELE